MPARLVSLSGHPSLAVVASLTMIGRDRGCDVRIESSRVSRRHCCVAIERDALLVRDLSSRNGTFINGTRIGRGRLRAGDELAIAHLRYRVEIVGDLVADETAEVPDSPWPGTTTHPSLGR